MFSLSYQAKSQRREDFGQTQEKQLMKVAHEVRNRSTYARIVLLHISYISSVPFYWTPLVNDNEIISLLNRARFSVWRQTPAAGCWRPAEPTAGCASGSGAQTSSCTRERRYQKVSWGSHSHNLLIQPIMEIKATTSFKLSSQTLEIGH